MQYIIIFLDDKTEQHPATYVQGSRKRWTDEDEALDHMRVIAPGRLPVLVPVPEVEIDESGYPIYQIYQSEECRVDSDGCLTDNDGDAETDMEDRLR